LYHGLWALALVASQGVAVLVKSKKAENIIKTDFFSRDIIFYKFKTKNEKLKATTKNLKLQET
jgi:hypothetical protein